MARSEALGLVREVELLSGSVRYRERGDGPPVVFVHGLLVNADLWRNVAPTVAEAGFRCIAPDWPLGSHEAPMPRADLTPPGVARLVATFLEALDLRNVVVVANDTGGAITQLVMVHHPERVGRVVLTPSDCFERFFPPPFAFLPAVSRLPGAVWLLVQLLRVRALHRLPITFGWVTKRPVRLKWRALILDPAAATRRFAPIWHGSWVACTSVTPWGRRARCRGLPSRCCWRGPLSLPAWGDPGPPGDCRSAGGQTLIDAPTAGSPANALLATRKPRHERNR